MAASRKAAHAAASPTKLFVSHCAPDGEATTLSPDKMSVAALRAALLGKQLSTVGLKAVLVARLQAAHTETQSAETGVSSQLPPPASVRPGTAHLGEVASAKDAALNKLAAGESRAVEHVALADDESMRVTTRGSKKQKRGGAIDAVVVEPGKLPFVKTRR